MAMGFGCNAVASPAAELSIPHGTPDRHTYKLSRPLQWPLPYVDHAFPVFYGVLSGLKERHFLNSAVSCHSPSLNRPDSAGNRSHAALFADSFKNAALRNALLLYPGASAIPQASAQQNYRALCAGPHPVRSGPRAPCSGSGRPDHMAVSQYPVERRKPPGPPVRLLRSSGGCLVWMESS